MTGYCLPSVALRASGALLFTLSAAEWARHPSPFPVGQEKKWRDFLGAAGKLGDIPFLGEVAKKVACLADFLKLIVPDDKRPSREIFLDFLTLVGRRRPRWRPKRSFARSSGTRTCGC